jgi:hypothetical protein
MWLHNSVSKAEDGYGREARETSSLSLDLLLLFLLFLCGVGKSKGTFP